MNEEKRLKRYYGEGGWTEEDGVKAIEEWRAKRDEEKKKEKKHYLWTWKNDTQLKSIDGVALKQVISLIQTALQKDYVYNPFCGRKIEDIKAESIISQCERCPFGNICFDIESIKAEANEIDGGANP